MSTFKNIVFGLTVAALLAGATAHAADFRGHGALTDAGQKMNWTLDGDFVPVPSIDPCPEPPPRPGLVTIGATDPCPEPPPRPGLITTGATDPCPEPPPRPGYAAHDDGEPDPEPCPPSPTPGAASDIETNGLGGVAVSGDGEPDPEPCPPRPTPGVAASLDAGFHGLTEGLLSYQPRPLTEPTPDPMPTPGPKSAQA